MSRGPRGALAAALLLAATLLVGACASPAAAPTTCGGSHAWPPNSWPLAPPGLALDVVSGTTVRFHNGTSIAWTAMIEPWEDTGCVGFVTSGGERVAVAPGATIDRTVADPGWGGEIRIGAELWDHPCDERCLDEPTAFLPAEPPPAASMSAASGPLVFSFDVENRSSHGVIVSVASDVAATMPGLEPGQRGTIAIPLANPQNGIGVEIQAPGCVLLAKGTYATPVPFTLLVSDGSQPATIALSTLAWASVTALPLPKNPLVGCAG